MTKIILISDTHGQEIPKELLPPGDIIIHSGDLTSTGTEFQLKDTLRWYSSLDYKYKIFIAGNHDFLAEDNPEKFRSIIPDNLIYLNDSGITIEGINIWGSPIQPWFYNWAFNRKRGEDIDKHWKLIPSNTDILVTHGPVAHIHDRTSGGDIVGCEDLLRHVQRIKPRLHVCGHIHEAYGKVNLGGTTFINASVLDETYRMSNPPVIFEI